MSYLFVVCFSLLLSNSIQRHRSALLVQQNFPYVDSKTLPNRLVMHNHQSYCPSAILCIRGGLVHNRHMTNTYACVRSYVKIASHACLSWPQPSRNVSSSQTTDHSAEVEPKTSDENSSTANNSRSSRST